MCNKWQPIATAPKGEFIIGGEWVAEQGGLDFRFFMSWWATDHWVGHPSHWVSAKILPQAPEQPGKEYDDNTDIKQPKGPETV